MGNWGLKLSKDGQNVNTAPNRNLIFSSSLKVVRVFYTGTFQLTIPAADDFTEVEIEVPWYTGDYIPASSSYIPAGFGIAFINGKRYATNTPAINAGGVSPTDFHYFNVTTFLSSFQATCNFKIGRLAGSSMTGVTETFLVKYYIIGAL